MSDFLLPQVGDVLTEGECFETRLARGSLGLRRKKQAEEKLWATDYGDSGLVFATGKGIPLDAQNIINRFFKLATYLDHLRNPLTPRDESRNTKKEQRFWAQLSQYDKKLSLTVV